jgi:hypothetical protein
MTAMKFLESLRLAAPGLLATLFVWLVAWQPLLAQEPATAGEEETEGRSWVLGYSLVVLCVGLGLFVVVRMGKRKTKKIRRKDEGQNWD